jgi:hypothetical protein
MESIESLTSYFHHIPQPVIILTSENEILSPDSLILYYANPVFREIVGSIAVGAQHTPELSSEGPHSSSGSANTRIVEILQAQCISPSTPKFMQWIDNITKKLKSTHILKSRFRGLTTAADDYEYEHRQGIIDIHWHGLVMQKRFVVLTGWTSGYIRTTEISPDGLVLSQKGSPQDEREGTVEDYSPKDSPKAPRSSISSDSEVSPERRKEGTRTLSPVSLPRRSRLSSFAEPDTDRVSSEGYTWRSNEKVCP